MSIYHTAPRVQPNVKNVLNGSNYNNRIHDVNDPVTKLNTNRYQ